MSDSWSLEATCMQHVHHLRTLVPEDMLKEAVERYVTRQMQEREQRRGEVGTAFAGTTDIVRQIATETIEPKLVERFGSIGYLATRAYVRTVGTYLNIRSRINTFLFSDADFIRKLCAAEVEFAGNELVRCWLDTLLLLADELAENHDDPSGNMAISFGGLFPVDVPGTEPLGGRIPVEWHTMFHGANTWRDVLEQDLLNLALDKRDGFKIWAMFTDRVAPLISAYTQRHSGDPNDPGYLVAVDNERTYALTLIDGDLAFTWRARTEHDPTTSDLP